MAAPLDADELALWHAFKRAGLVKPLQVVRDGVDAMSYLLGLSVFSDREAYPVPNILLIDLNLPRLNGLELLAWLRTQPEFQHLMVGDHIPLGRGPSWPVAVLEPNRALVLDMRNMGDFDWVWQFGLYPIGEKQTRLVSRSRVGTQSDWARLATYAIEPAGFLMTRRMLLGLKQRAEALTASRTDPGRANRRAA